MANILQLKRSSVPGKIPTTANLALGELGINTYDGKLFLKQNNGTDSIIDVTAGTKTLKGRITGLIQKNNSGNPSDVVDISAGSCRSDDDTIDLLLNATISKDISASWAEGNNQGGLDTGTVANDTWYYIWLIYRSDTAIVDALFSTSSTSPTLPTNYDSKRLIGAVYRNSSSSISGFQAVEMAGGGIEVAWTTPILDIQLLSVLSTTRRLDTILVPSNLPIVATLNVIVFDTAFTTVYISNPDLPDLAPSTLQAPLATITTSAIGSNAKHQAAQIQIRTNTSAQIASRASTTVDEYRVSTLSFQWSRV